MLSYQHGYHAGNRADVLKHAVLHTIISGLTAEPASLLYIETHAGRGQYDLTGEQSRKTGEADLGVISLLSVPAPKPLAPWLDLVHARGRTAYPGSPAIAASRLRSGDRVVLFEKHPTEHTELSDAFGDDPRVQIKKADGYSGALRLQPRRGERLCVFVDPSYETERDMEALAEWAPKALSRWPNAVIVLWLPLFFDERELDFGAYLAELSEGAIAGARWPVDPDVETALIGSAIIAYGIDDKTSSAMSSIANSLQSVWGSGKDSDVMPV
ncbi:MAG: 23S rRNA (adenine(2030)-N(6))-methyltransferase RlmJ [Pseudomonadota bacterium]